MKIISHLTSDSKLHLSVFPTVIEVVMVVSVAQVSAICAEVQSQNSTEQTRGSVPTKEEKYTTRSNTDDPPPPPLSSSKQYQSSAPRKFPPCTRCETFRERRRMAKEVDFPAEAPESCRKGKVKRNHRSRRMPKRKERHFDAREADDDDAEDAVAGPDGRYRPRQSEAPVLNFGSPEQLQEYLYSEAAHAKHILRGGSTFQSKNLGQDSEFYPKSSIADDLESYNEGITSSKKHRTYANSSAAHGSYHVHAPPKNTKKIPGKPTQSSPKKEGSATKPGYSRHNYEQLHRRDNSFLAPPKFGYPNGNDFKSGPEYLMTKKGFPEERHREYPVPKLLPPNYFFGSEAFDDPRLSHRNRPPYFHPFGMPYMYPPPWFAPRPPFYIPRVRFAYPYDRKLYESSPYPGQSSKKPEKNESSLGDDIVKLKQMVDELDVMNEEAKEMSQLAGKNDAVAREKEVNDTVAEVRDKIDKIVIPILSKISKDLNSNSSVNTTLVKRAENVDAETKKDREKDREKDADAKKDYPCKLDGLWIGRNEGLKLNITTLPNMTMRVSVVSDHSKKGSGINKDWTISGITLASFGGPFMFAAVYPEKKRIANFLGQCRTCREEDIIFGLWTFSTAGKDCTDMFTTVETKIDVFRREKSQQTKNEKSLKSLTES